MASILPSKNTTITSTPIAGTQISSSSKSKNTGTSSKSTSSTSKSAGGSSSKPVSSSPIYGTSSSGSKYTIGSEKGRNFVNSAASGSTMTGGDGSTWTKNSDGSTTIKTTSGQTFQVGGSTGGSSGGSSGGGSGYVQYTGGNAAMDAAIQPYKDAFNQAYQTGDVQAMINANNSANQIRNQYGYAAEHLNVANLPGYAEYASGGGGGSASGGGGGSAAGTVSTPQINLPTYENYVTDLSDYLNQMYAEQQKAALAAINSAYQQNVAALDKAQSEIAPQYQSARNQTAGTSEQAARNFAEYAAANGLGSGASAQADLARGIALQNNLNQLNESEANAYADLELQKSQAEIEYNNAIAQAQASNNAELAAALYQEKVRLQNALTDQQNTIFQQAVQAQQLQMQAQQNAIVNQQWQQTFDFNANQADIDNQYRQDTFDYQKYLDLLDEAWRNKEFENENRWRQYGYDFEDKWNQYGYDFEDKWNSINLENSNYWKGQDLYYNNFWNSADYALQKDQIDYQRQQDAKENLVAWGNALLDLGVMPPDEMLSALGLDKSTAQLIVGVNAAPVSTYTGSSGRTTSGSSGRTPSGDGVSYDNGSRTAAEIKQMQAALGVTEDGYWGPNTQAAAGGLSADEYWQLFTAPGYNDAYFSAAMRSISSQLASGDTNTALSGIESLWPELSITQKQRASAMLNAYGYSYEE